MEDKKNIYEKLSEIQNELKAPKSNRNTFGNYNYRSAEDILEAVKPLCKKHKTTLKLSDEIIMLGNRFYVKATATLYDQENSVATETSAYARESEEKKGMDGSQITGTASSYARKYALNGLFNIDDTKDADTDEYNDKTKEEKDMMIQEGQKQYIMGHLSKSGLETQLNKYKAATIDALTWKQANEIYNIIDDKLKEKKSTNVDMDKPNKILEDK